MPILGFYYCGVHHGVNHLAQMNDHYIPVLEYAASPVSGIPLKEMRALLSDLEKAEILINVKGKYRLKS